MGQSKGTDIEKRKLWEKNKEGKVSLRWGE